jgi:hypothetical protein
MERGDFSALTGLQLSTAQRQAIVADNDKQEQTTANAATTRQRSRQRPQRSSTLLSVRQCGKEYEVRISRRLVKIAGIPLLSALFALGAGSVSGAWTWGPGSEPTASTSAPEEHDEPDPRRVYEEAAAIADESMEAKRDAARNKDHRFMLEG